MTVVEITHAADPLSDVLRTVRLTGAIFFLFRAPRGFQSAMPDGAALAKLVIPRAQRVISYHVVREGHCFGTIPGEPPVRLDAGDILVLPRGDPYRMAGEEDGIAGASVDASVAFLRSLQAERYPFTVSVGAPEALELVCGFLGCDLEPFNPLLSALPRMLVVRRGAVGGVDRLDRLIDLTLAEARDAVPGNDAVRMRLSELIFVEVVRRHLASLPEDRNGWLSALSHPIAGRALSLLHERPAEPWTLPSLAEAAGASRTALADHFTRLVGEPPIQYLTKWRMQVAARLLGDGEMKVSAVAIEVGYDSEAAFSRAFKKIVGVPPAAWRERTGAPERA